MTLLKLTYELSKEHASSFLRIWQVLWGPGEVFWQKKYHSPQAKPSEHHSTVDLRVSWVPESFFQKELTLMIRTTVKPEEEQPCCWHKCPVFVLFPGVVKAPSLSHKEPLSASALSTSMRRFQLGGISPHLRKEDLLHVLLMPVNLPCLSNVNIRDQAKRGSVYLCIPRYVLTLLKNQQRSKLRSCDPLLSSCYLLSRG